MFAWSFPIRRGLACMAFSIFTDVPFISKPSFFATTPMMVMTQLARAAVTMWVGAKDRPFPPLSTGRSVINLSPVGWDSPTIVRDRCQI